jgi:hypothetical protein
MLPDPVFMDHVQARTKWEISTKKRDAWLSMPESEGKSLTKAIPNLNVVEVDNGISNSSSCSGTTLRVVAYNAERGTSWLQASILLKKLGADVILLNEMDIGMARSDQQHTTRLLASFLNMNYAWGLEFLELTRGTKQEQAATEGLHNFLGLHGNAILSKCKIFDPLLLRDDIGPYFSDNSSSRVNAGGYEKRLGGRMILLAHIQTEGGTSSVVVGSTHKFSRQHPSYEKIREYIGSSPAVIGGDQDWGFCERVGLLHVDNKAQFTWPASCDSDGSSRGDILCSNMDIIGPSETLRPCVKTTVGNQIQLSDHAIITASLTCDSRENINKVS